MNNGGPLSYLEMARARRLREGQSEAWNANYTLPGQNLDSIAANKWYPLSNISPLTVLFQVPRH